MKAIKKRLYDFFLSTERDFQDKIFLLASLLTFPAMCLVTIGDIITGENVIEIIGLASSIFTVPVMTILSIRFKKSHIFAPLLALGIVFYIIPIVFFFGGGLHGGAVIWFSYCYLFIGLILTGKLRVLMFVLLSIMVFVEYMIAWLKPEWISPHSDGVFIVDSGISVLVVGIIIYVLVSFQNKLYIIENNRAKDETERAEEMNRNQNRFFSSMSHEIRTPINSILGLNEVILRQEDASDEIIRDATNIQGSGKMLLSLINDILDFSKIEAGSMDIVPVDYKIGDTMSEIVNMIWIRATEKGLNFSVDIDPNVPSGLYGDEVRIKQIIINLLNNAVKYTKEGSVGLHIESESIDESKVRLLISVTDTGMGIRSEVLPDLFDAFKRVDQQKNRNIEGTGLGLSIVHQLVDLMGGEVSVNSVYGQGSTFTVSLVQEISNNVALGNVSIIGQAESVTRQKHEAMFTAPEACVLIVDDNEMNLEVEKKLLESTRIVVDTVLSGAAALKQTVQKKYDVILMDHLMPEMDGIECLDQIRHQTGGLNSETPVLVLTANAGSANRELYNNSGFDGYLVKPVSGRQLEEMLMRHISKEKLVISKSVQMNAGEMNTARGYSRMASVVFATTSLADMPENIANELDVHILPYTVVTDEGVFRDNYDINADEVVRYMESGRDAKSIPQEESVYVEFFGELLKRSHHVIYIALTTSMSEDYERASRAATVFENVTVINSEAMSSSLSLLLLQGYKMAQQNMPVKRIIKELESMKKRLCSSFIIKTTEYMSRKGLVSHRIHRIARSLELRPALKYKDDKYGIGGVWMGSVRHCYMGYIKKALSRRIDPDTDVLFVTYVSISEEDLAWIDKKIRARADFEHIIYQQASAAVSSNSGPGTFGLLYMKKGDKSYNIGSLIPKNESVGIYDPDDSDDEVITHLVKAEEEKAAPMMAEAPAEEDDSKPDKAEESKKTESEVQTPEKAEQPEKLNEKPQNEEPADPVDWQAEWFMNIEGIDGELALRNSGSEEGLQTIMKIFYDSIPAKASEIDEYYRNEDWDNYVIKTHALKSSARLVGARKLGDEAQELESAGKNGDTAYIDENHEKVMAHYRSYLEYLKDGFGEKPEAAATSAKKEETAEKKHILIVDDDPAFAKMVHTWLKEDYKADVVTSGKMVFPFLKKKGADLILLDKEMPEPDGIQVVRQLREDPEYADLSVVFMTEGEESAEESGEAGSIEKSFTKDELSDYLKNLF